MQFTFAAVLALAATATAAYSNDTIVYTTVVVDSIVTVCPGLATLTLGGHTYTNTLTEVRTAPKGIGLGSLLSRCDNRVISASRCIS